jgi:hypothetical protein
MTAVSAGKAAQLEWPLEATIRFTSSFCEYRPFRFHAGLDFSTGGVPGVPIKAVDDGYVWRLRVSPYGYGKVIYLRLADGRTAVYAHLDRFDDVLERLVRLEQERRQSYTIDLFLQPDQARFSRGDVIARSGRTGIGVPHLHFEIRDRNNRPLNPLANGLLLDDTVEPTIGALSFIPLDGAARVDEHVEPAVVPLAKYGDVWTTRKHVALHGRVGVAMAGWDRTQRGRYRLSLRSMSMAVDGVEVFSRQYDRMTFGSQHLSVFDRNFPLHVTKRGRYFNMFVAQGNSLPYYGDRLPGAGVLACGTSPGGPEEMELPPGEHEITFTVWDFDGNTAQAAVTVYVDRPPRITKFQPHVTQDGHSIRIEAVDSTDMLTLRGYLSQDNGETWSQVDSGSDSAVADKANIEIFLPTIHEDLVVRAVAVDTLGLRATRMLRLSENLDKPPKYELNQRWGRDWVAFDIVASHPFRESPTVAATWGSEMSVPMNAKEVSPGLYEAEIRPNPAWPDDFVVRVLAGEGPPTVVSQWRRERSIPGQFDPVTAADSTKALYRGVVVFTDAFPDTGGVLRLNIAGQDTSLSVRGGLIGRWGGEFYTRDRSAGIEVGRGVLPEPMFVRIIQEDLPTWSELEPIGKGFRFEPQIYPLLGEATTVISIDDSVDMKGVGLYGYSSDKVELLTPADGAFDHTIRARVRSLYTVGVYRDVTPPTIFFISPASAAESLTPIIEVRVKDAGAGFLRDDGLMEMRIDDRWVPAEYDPEEHRFDYKPLYPLEKGEHTVVVHARDAVGNEASATHRFTIE